MIYTKAEWIRNLYRHDGYCHKLQSVIDSDKPCNVDCICTAICSNKIMGHTATEIKILIHKHAAVYITEHPEEFLDELL